jgi:hypothetical protein
MKNVDDPTRRPRLMLTYRLPEVQPAEADWGQIRHDAQHSGRYSWAMYDDPTGISPNSKSGGSKATTTARPSRRAKICHSHRCCLVTCC